MLPQSIAKAISWSIQFASGRGDLVERLRTLEESQWFSQDDLRELSFRKLERLLIHAFETVPYYRTLMARHGFDPYKLQDANDVRRLPVLTREDLELNYEALKSSRIGEYYAHESCSSGSTGRPARFMQDFNHDLWSRAHQLRTYRWCGDWKVGQKFALVWGSPVYWDRQTVYRKIEAHFTNRIELNCNTVGPRNLLAMARRLERFDPHLISGYSTALYLITETARQNGIRFPSLRALQPNAEPTYDNMADAMTSYFGVPVYDKYGSTETNILAHQSPANRDLMCIQSENAHVEFVRENGEACAVGEKGKLVVTTLNNYSMPLIRYATSDVAAPLAGSCPSGRGFPLMTKVRGRQYDRILTSNGDAIHPQIFSNLFSNFTSVAWFQVVQNNLEELEIALMMRERPDLALEAKIKRMINLRTGTQFWIKFTYIENPPSSATGKHKICVNNLGT